MKDLHLLFAKDTGSSLLAMKEEAPFFDDLAKEYIVWLEERTKPDWVPVKQILLNRDQDFQWVYSRTCGVCKGAWQLVTGSWFTWKEEEPHKYHIDTTVTHVMLPMPKPCPPL